MPLCATHSLMCVSPGVTSRCLGNTLDFSFQQILHTFSKYLFYTPFACAQIIISLAPLWDDYQIFFRYSFDCQNIGRASKTCIPFIIEASTAQKLNIERAETFWLLLRSLAKLARSRAKQFEILMWLYSEKQKNLPFSALLPMHDLLWQLLQYWFDYRFGYCIWFKSSVSFVSIFNFCS